jgi:hypothetical protein
MKKLFAAAAACFAAIPGLAVLLSETGVPPGQVKLFGAVTETFGALAILVIWVNRKRIREMTPDRVTTIAIRVGVGALLALLAYIALYDLTVCKKPPRSPVYYPVLLSGAAARIVRDAGGRCSAVETYGSDEVREAIDKMPALALPATTGLLLVIFLTAFTGVATAFGLVGVRESDLVGEDDAGAAGAPTPQNAR